MDALSYVNSSAIHDYLKKIEYSFDSLETAWLIYSCKKLSYIEKKKEWSELIQEMSDCPVPKRSNCRGWDSLHDLIRQYINIMDAEITDFFKDETSGEFVYMYSYLYEEDRSWTEEYETIFPSLKECLEAYREDVDELDETHNPDGTGVIKYRLKKQSLADRNEVYEIECNSNGDVMDILRNSTREADAADVIDSFDGMWFDFPTPFKKGDIVWVPCSENNIRWNCDGAFVLLGLSTWDANEYIRNSGDTSDMNGYGYFVNENGTIYREVMHNYMDLEYYYGPYKLNEKILPALSMYIKGEIEVDFLMCAYRKILLEIASDDSMLKSWYSEETVKKLGLD